MKWFRAVRWWHGLVSVVIAALVAVVTNLATGESSSWRLVAALVALVGVQGALMVWQSAEDQRAKREARDELLGPLRPPIPDSPGLAPSLSDQSSGAAGGTEARAVVHLLTAPFSPTPLWGRKAVRDRLVTWCVQRDPQAGVVRVVTGPAGVGKSRLALAVAESLPTGWAAGWLQGSGAGLIERIADAGDPTLVIVDDTDRVPHLDTLITQASRYPDLVRLLLLTRTGASLRALPDTVLPQLTRVEPLTPVGEAGDRQRWYVEAVRAYARELRVSPPDLPNRPVGSDEDTLLVLHARALLAALGRTNSRTWSLAEIVTELVMLEQRTWYPDLPQLPGGCDLDVLAEAVTVLLLLPAPTLEDAAERLRRVPQFTHDTAHQTRVAVARWAHRRYPPGPDHRLNFRPHLLAERLLLDTLTRTPQLLHGEDSPAAALVLTRAYPTFPDALKHLTALLIRQRNVLPDVLAAVLATGVTDPHLDRSLAALIDTDDIANDVETRTQLIALTPPPTLPYLSIAHGHLLVTHYRSLTETDRYRPELANSLNGLGVNLSEVGRPREALAVAKEAVAIHRLLTEAEPDRYRPELANSLNSLAVNLSEVGRPREALAAAEEAVAIRRLLTETEADRHRPDLANSLHNLAINLREVGRPREALTAAEETVAIRRLLTETEPNRYRPDLATSLHNLGVNLREVGRPREALTVAEEAVAIRRLLTKTEPDRYRPKLALSLNGLAINLREVGRPREALTVAEETVAIHRLLTETEPNRYRPELANSLNSLAINLSEVGRPREALTVAEETVAIRRLLTETEPDRYRPELAASLNNLGANLREVGRPREALAAAEEAVAIYRLLTEAEPDRYRPELATSLNGLAIQLKELGGNEGSLHAYREAVAVWKACAEQDSELHGPSYQHALSRLRRQLEQAGHYEDVMALGLDIDTSH